MFIKKIIAFILVICIILMNLVSFASGIMQPEIKSYGFLSQENSVITTLGSETAVKGYADVQSVLNGYMKNGILVLSCYDNNKLLDVKIAHIVVDNTLKRVETPLILVPGDLRNIVFKVTILDSLNTMRPLVEVYGMITSDAVPQVNGITVSINDIVYVGTNDTYVYFDYLENPDDAAAKSVKIDANAPLYVNGIRVLVNDASALIQKLENFYGEVTLARNNVNSLFDYDAVYIKNYTNIVVDSVDAISKKIYTKNNNDTITYDSLNSNINATLYDEIGQLMNWEDLKEWDVVSCKITNTPNKTVIYGQVVENSVIGQITSVDVSGKYTKYEINGKYYMMDSYGISTSELSLGDEGVFYLDALGRIAYYNSVAPIINYAYVVAVKAGNSFESPQLKIFNYKGETLTLETSYRVKIDGITNIDGQDVLGDNWGTSDYISVDSIFGSEVDYLISDHGKVIYGVASESDYLSSITKVKGIKIGDFITYNINSINQITVIDRPFNVTSISDVAGKFTQFGVANSTSADYNVSVESITNSNGQKVYIDANTIFMVGYGTDENNYKVCNMTDITTDLKLSNVTFFDVDVDKIVNVVLVTSYEAVEPVEDPIVIPLDGMAAVKTGSYTVNATTGYDNYTLNTCQNGVDNVKLVTVNDNFSLPSIGSLVMPIKNVKGEVTAFTSIATVDATNKKVTIENEVKNPNNDKVKYYFGNIQEISGYNVTLKATSSSIINTVGAISKAQEFSASRANVYVYDMRISNTTRRVYIDDINIVDVMYNSGVTTFDPFDGYVSNMVAVAREYDGVIKDIMLYIFN